MSLTVCITDDTWMWITCIGFIIAFLLLEFGMGNSKLSEWSKRMKGAAATVISTNKISQFGAILHSHAVAISIRLQKNISGLCFKMISHLMSAIPPVCDCIKASSVIFALLQKKCEGVRVTEVLPKKPSACSSNRSYVLWRHFKMVIFFLIVLINCTHGTSRQVELYPTMQPNTKNAEACRINGSCHWPGSFMESYVRKHCFRCPLQDQLPYCVTDTNTKDIYYICTTVEEMQCNKGFYGIFTFLNGNILVEKEACGPGTFLNSTRDCRGRKCEDMPSIEPKYKVLKNATFDGGDYLLECNKEKGLCVIDGRYGKTFLYTHALNFHDVCGVPAPGKDCVYPEEKPTSEIVTDQVEYRENSTSPHVLSGGKQKKATESPSTERISSPPLPKVRSPSDEEEGPLPTDQDTSPKEHGPLPSDQDSLPNKHGSSPSDQDSSPKKQSLGSSLPIDLGPSSTVEYSKNDGAKGKYHDGGLSNDQSVLIICAVLAIGILVIICMIHVYRNKNVCKRDTGVAEASSAEEGESVDEDGVGPSGKASSTTTNNIYNVNEGGILVNVENYRHVTGTKPGSIETTEDSGAEEDMETDTTDDEPSPDEPLPDEPSHDEPSPDEPSPDELSHDEPSHDEPSPDEPLSDEPSPDEPLLFGGTNTGY